MKIFNIRVGPKRLMSFVLLLLTLTMLLPSQVFATTSSKKDDGAKPAEEIGVSLYDTQTALVAYVNNVVGVNGNDKHDDNKVESTAPSGNVIGNAGAYVGYGDVDKGFYSFIMSNLTYGASTSTYSAWQDICKSDGNQVYAYTRFGRALADSGLDSTASVTSNNPRFVSGVFTLLFYALSELIPKMFGLALKILKFLNPFALLSEASTFQGYWHDAFPNAPAMLTPAVDAVCNIFDIITNDLTWTVMVPLFIAMVALNILLLRKKAGTLLANLLKRIVFLAIGLPICAGLYTGVLNQMFEIVSHGTASSQMVVSTVFDFESWVTENQLAIPSGALIASAPSDKSDRTSYQNPADAITPTSANAGVATAEMLRNLRTTAYTINKTTHDEFSSMGDMTSADSMHFMLTGDMWNKNANYSGSGNTAFLGITSITDDLEVSTGIFDMLVRYTSGSFYRATDFETSYMNLLTTQYRTEMGHTASTAGASSNRNKVYDMFDMTNEVDDWLEREESDNKAVWSGSSSNNHLGWVGRDWNVFRGGSLRSDTLSPTATMTFSSGSKGLSTQSMYNYLSTAFDSNSVVVYSNKNSVSENTKQQHYAVNTIGTGILNFAFMMNMCVILGILVVIAFVFSLNLAIHNLKRGCSLIGNVPIAMLGVVKSIAQVVSYVIAMICEIIISVFLYLFISNMLVLIATIVESLASSRDVTGLSGTILNAIGISMTDISSSELSVVFMVLAETMLAIFLFVGMMFYRRAWCRVRYNVSCKWYKFMTLPEMMPVYEQVIANEKSRKESDFTFKKWVTGLATDLNMNPVPA